MQTTSNGANRAYYVYQDSGQHVGPVTADLLAKGIASGKVPRDAHVGAVGDTSWRPVLSIPEIATKLAELERNDRKSIPPIRSVAPAAPPPPGTEPDVTNIMVRDEDIESAVGKAKPAAGAPSAPRAPAAPKVPSVPRMAAVGAAPLPPKTPAPPAPPAAQAAPMPPVPPAPPAPPGAPGGGGPPSKSNPPSVMPMSGPPNTTPQTPPPPGAVPAPPGYVPPAPTTAPILPSAGGAPAAAAPAPAPAAEKKEEKKDDKPPPVDPKMSLIVPAASFGVFAIIAVIILAIGLIKASKQHKEPAGTVHGGAPSAQVDDE